MEKQKLNLRRAEISDADNLTQLFIGNLKQQPGYISHGEMQMGVGTIDGKVTSDASELWKKYIVKKMENEEESNVFVYEDGGKIIGFTVVEINDDGNDSFGVICDLYILPENRTKGLGSTLFDKGISWLKDKGMTEFYLESGKSNHEAHNFFEKRGFTKVSHIYYNNFANEK